jgi:signal transduction histidine kinase
MCVYAKAAGWIIPPSNTYNFVELINDVSQIIGSFLFGSFIYHALINEDVKFKKLKYVFQCYVGFTLFYVLTVVLFPRFILHSFNYFIVSRVIVTALSLILYYHIIIELKNIYLRYLFLAITALLLSGIFALWDSLTTTNPRLYTGFQCLCLGYILENISFACAFIFKYFSTDKQKNEAEARHQLQLSEVQLEMQLQTMQNIGREIHDNVGQKLTLASLYTQQLAHENQAPIVLGTIQKISNIINQSLYELRQLSKSLTNDIIENNNLHTLLKIECDRFNELKKCSVNFVSNSKLPDLDYQKRSILLRITQEFMQNSTKHSDCKTITIALNYSNGLLQILLEDDGKGFDINNKNNGGIGLINIKKRAELIGATHTFINKKSLGTKLLLELPI